MSLYNVTSNIYTTSSGKLSLGITLPCVLLVNLGTWAFIFFKLKLLSHVKKVLYAHQVSNLSILILMTIGYVSNFYFEDSQWTYGLLCDFNISFYINSFTFSHLIGRIRFYLANETNNLKGTGKIHACIHVGTYLCNT